MIDRDDRRGLSRVGNIGWRWGLSISISLFGVLPGTGNEPFLAPERLEFLASLVGSMEAFNQNPATDAKDGAYRLYTRVQIRFQCCNNTIVWYDVLSDMDGGKELPGISGTIHLTDMNPDWPGPRVLANANGIEAMWRGWGAPNAAAEPSFQWVAIRTSRYIWHTTHYGVICRGGKGFHRVFTFHGSRFPTHRLWLNGLIWNTLPQGSFADLWTPAGFNHNFVQ